MVKKAEVESYKKQLSEYDERIPQMEKQNEKLAKKLQKAKAKFDEAEAKIQSEIEGPKSEINSLEERKGKLKLKLQIEDNDIERCKETIQSINLAREEKEVNDLQSDLEHEQKNMQKLEEEYRN